MNVNIPEQGLLLTSACRCCSQFSLLCASQTPCHRWTLSRTCRTWGPGSCHEPSSDGSLVSRSSCSAYGRLRRRGRSQGKFGSTAWSHYRPRHWRGGLQQSGWWRSRWAGIQACPSWLKWPGEKVMWHKKKCFQKHTLTLAKACCLAKLAFSAPSTLGRHMTRSFCSIFRLCRSATYRRKNRKWASFMLFALRYLLSQLKVFKEQSSY